MRLYTFCNCYLSSIQQGIQSAHLVHELFVKYRGEESPKTKLLWNWATNHKTMIVLNGGAHNDVKEISNLLFQTSHLIGRDLGFQEGLPWANFYEDAFSLDGILTCVGVVVPQQFYDVIELDNSDVKHYVDQAGLLVPHANPTDLAFINLLKSKGLAR